MPSGSELRSISSGLLHGAKAPPFSAHWNVSPFSVVVEIDLRVAWNWKLIELAFEYALAAGAVKMTPGATVSGVLFVTAVAGSALAVLPTRSMTGLSPAVGTA